MAEFVTRAELDAALQQVRRDALENAQGRNTADLNLAAEIRQLWARVGSTPPAPWAFADSAAPIPAQKFYSAGGLQAHMTRADYSPGRALTLEGDSPALEVSSDGQKLNILRRSLFAVLCSGSVMITVARGDTSLAYTTPALPPLPLDVGDSYSFLAVGARAVYVIEYVNATSS